MEGLKKAKIVEQLAEFDKKLSTNPFEEYGSLCYNADWDSSNDKFVVGPTTNRNYFDDGRGKMNIDCGPCKFPYLKLFLYANILQGGLLRIILLLMHNVKKSPSFS